MDFKAVDLYLLKLKNGNNNTQKIDDADLADYLETIKEKDENKFFDYLNTIPLDLKAQTFIELPITFQIDLIIKYEAQGLADILEHLESDDATDLFQVICRTDNEKSENVFLLLNDQTQKNIEKLIQYAKNEAGSLMQTEIFKVSSKRTVKYAIEKLRTLKSQGLGTIQSIYIIDEQSKLLNTINIDDLILEEHETILENLVNKYPQTYSIASHDSVDEVVSLIEKYDLVNLAVIDRMGHLLGRITHDDVIDLLQINATKQIYNLNQIDENEQIQEKFFTTTKTRAKWLTINLINVTLASIVIGFFESTLNAIVALAVLMPIVANMAGTSSAQTMTVVVRQLALGEIHFSNLKTIIKKEMIMASINGVFFGVLVGFISQIRYGDILISLSICISIFFSFLCASFLGTSIPMLLKKLNVDPAIASSVFVLTIVDIIGFFSFLMIAKMIIL